MQPVFMTRHHLTYFSYVITTVRVRFCWCLERTFFQRSDNTHVYHVVTRPVVSSPDFSLKKVLKSNKVLRVDRQNEKLSQGWKSTQSLATFWAHLKKVLSNAMKSSISKKKIFRQKKGRHQVPKCPGLFVYRGQFRSPYWIGDFWLVFLAQIGRP